MLVGYVSDERYVAIADVAIEIDRDGETVAVTHSTARGKVLGWYEWKFSEGELALRRAVAANPNYADAHWALGSLLPTTGHMKEALQEIRTARLLDPLSPVIAYWRLLFTISRSSLPTLKRGRSFSGTGTGSPVRGFRPL